MTSGSDLANNPRGARAYHTGIVLAVVSTVAVLLRLLARWKTKASFAADDLLIAISLLPFYVMVILTYLGNYHACPIIGPWLIYLVSCDYRTSWAVDP